MEWEACPFSNFGSPFVLAQITQPEEGINISPSQNAHKKF